MSDKMIVHIVSDEACPECGAYWGHPNKLLDFPNRPKVDDHWRCYNPNCNVAYYRDGEITEMEPSPEERAALDAKMEEFQKYLQFGKWEQTSDNGNGITSYRFIPAEGTENPLAADDFPGQ